mmetsp:Transcript_16969/g.22223  ORF Transcript_16969/g.22223 Transcript_16969/m.22223 type:complete len:527 (-) Transcript_16969:361-1941(-)
MSRLGLKSENICWYTVFNQREWEFKEIFGVTNTTLVDLMSVKQRDKAQNVESTLRCAFQFLGTSGDTPTTADKSALFRGNFTPNFYPQRFVMKDSIYEQRLEVLAILLNQVLNRYWKGGVGYVEFSISSKDLLHDGIITTLALDSFHISQGNSNKKKWYHRYQAFTDEPLLKQCTSNWLHNLTGEMRNCLPSWAKDFGDLNPRGHKADFRFLAAFNRNKIQDKQAFGEVVTEAKRLSSMNGQLSKLVEEWCSDEKLSKLYQDELKKIQKFETKMLVKPQNSREETLFQMRRNLIVGLDWVGDEYMFPFCALSHTSVVDFVQKCNKFNERFGVRIHGGENVVRPVRGNISQEHNIAYEMTMMILMKGVDLLIEKRLPVRIGHGVAFLSPTEGNSDLGKKLESFRKSCQEKEVSFEINPTSNDMLLIDDFQSKDIKNNGAKLADHLSFDGKQHPGAIICTDNDGIWAIHKCKPHYHHVSVAAELCQLIQKFPCKMKKDNLEKLVRFGKSQRFVKKPTMIPEWLFEKKS